MKVKQLRGLVLTILQSKRNKFLYTNFQKQF